jgi:tRNA(Ser,Leu) C12 N-acetylase TAN1
MTWSVLDVAEARHIVGVLLDALSLKKYVFSLEPDDGAWDIQVEYGAAGAWQTRTMRVDDRLLRDAADTHSAARGRLIADWQDRLVGEVAEGSTTPTGSRPIDWNAVATTYPEAYGQARSLLSRYGEVATTGYFNVLLITVASVSEFLARLEAATRDDATLLNAVSRLVPSEASFRFQSPEEFEDKARQAVDPMVARLAGRRFHVRIHRRGFKGRLSSQAEEQFLDHYLLERLEQAGTPGSITFDDPDAIVTVETVGQEAGIACWSREQQARYPFLNLD